MLNVFKNEEFGELRNINIKGKEYFSAKDVALKLGYKNTNDAIIRHCKGVVKHEVGYKTSDRANVQVLTTNFIPEGDVYRLIIKSKLPAAEKFEKWVFEEVLPSIRKKGCYISDKITNKQIKEAKKYLNLTQIKKIMKTCLAIDLEYNYKLAVAGMGIKDKDKLDNEVIKILRKRSVSVEGQELIYKIIEKKNKKNG